MVIRTTVYRDPLYFAWKLACNTLYGKSAESAYLSQPDSNECWSRETLFDLIEREYGCKTVKVEKHNGYNRFVTLEFESEATMAWFLLRWSK